MTDPSSQLDRQCQDGIAIVGMACIFPKAPDLKTYWRNIVSKVDAIGDPPAGSLINLVHDPASAATNRIYCNRGGYLKDLPSFNPSDFGVMPVAIDGAEPEHFIALKVAYDALLDAGFPEKNFNREKVEVLLGRGTFVNRGYMTAMQHSVVVDQTIRILKELHPHYGEDTLASLQSALMQQLPPFTPETAPGLCHNVMAGLIANRLNLQGRNLVLDAACATCLLALEIGMDDLLLGKCDAALVGGVQISTHAPIHMIFTQLGALSHQPHLRPFDRNADGTMLGEGIGMLVLKRLQDAVACGHRIYAVIKGIGSSSDGRGTGLLAPRMEGEELAIRRAYDRAHIDPATVELVEAHGTGIPLGDVTEIKALAKVFGQRNGSVPNCAVGTVKSMIGHLIPAAGAAGMIKAALAVYHKVHPPTLFCDDPNPALELEKTPFFINTETRPWIHGSTAYPRRAAVSSFGFGGINAHAVIEEYNGPHGQKPISLDDRRDSELFVIVGDNRAELAQQCMDISKIARDLRKRDNALLSDLAYTLNSSLAGKELRLAVIAESLEDLQKKLDSAAERIADEKRHQIKDRSGIFFFAKPLAGDGGKLAFLFPGEGSQYVNMLADLCLHFPEARSCFDLLDQAYADHPRNYLPSQVIFPPNAPARAEAEKRIWQMDGAVDAVSTANRALCKIITSLGIKPDAILGHSSGELAALEASGAVILKAEREVTGHIRTGNRIIEALSSEGSFPEGKLLAVGGVGQETVHRIIAQSDDFLCIAMDNCPHQFVLCGTDVSVERAAGELKKAGAICQLLPFSRAYHTERFEPALQLLEGFFENGRFAGPAVPLYSCMTAGLFPGTPAGVKEYAVKQWARPVRFRETIEAMYADGIRIFLEVGPRANLTGFVQDILGKRPFLAVASNVHHRSGITQLNHALGFLVAHGVEVNLAQLYANRAVAKIDLQDPADAQGKTSRRGMKISLELPLLSLKGHAILEPELPLSETLPASAPSPQAATGGSSATQWAGAGMQEYFRTMENFLVLQEQVMTSFLGNSGADAAKPWQGASSPEASTPSPPVPAGAIFPVESVARQSFSVPAPDDHAAIADTRGMGTAPAQASSLTADATAKLLLDLVSEKTGYPPEMLGLDQNLEADLGIDSIKKVEILGALAKHTGRLSDSQTEGLTRLTTLGEIIQALAEGGGVPAAAKSEPAGAETSVDAKVGKSISEETIRQSLLDLVSEKTGYPVGMIALDQNLEADLGIDSIKRVEILGAFAKQVGSLPETEAEGLNRLKTLQEIIGFMAARLAGPPRGPAQPVTALKDLRKDVSAKDDAGIAAGDARPFSGTVVHEVPGREVTTHLAIDLKNDLFLAHHTLGGQVSRENRALLALPVMPFNMAIEIMAQAAGRLFPGEFLVGMENLLARNWIIFDKEQISLRVAANVPPGSARASVQLFLLDGAKETTAPQPAAEGTFIFASTFPAVRAAEPLQIRNPRNCTIPPDKFYPGALFHGPVFRTIASVSQCGDDGAEAVLRRPAANEFFQNIARPEFLTDPVLLDGAGQAVGLWAEQNLDSNYIIFPIALKAAHFFMQPDTRPPEVVCRLQSRGSRDTVTSNIDLAAGGHLYARLEGLRHKRIDMPEILHHFRGSREVMLSAEWTGPLEPFADRDKMACCRIDAAKYDFNGTDGKMMRSVIAHIILNGRERSLWAGLPGTEKRKTEWLLGRLAAKEAVRRLMKKISGPDVWSADIEIIADENGKPCVAGKWLDQVESIPCISLSHSDGTAVSLAKVGKGTSGVGIDIEKVRHLDNDFQRIAFTPDELKMVSHIDGNLRTEWLVRLWCAKEAAAKALGCGIPGSPKDIIVREIQFPTGVVSLEIGRLLREKSPGLNFKEVSSCTLLENENIVALSCYP